MRLNRILYPVPSPTKFKILNLRNTYLLFPKTLLIGSFYLLILFGITACSKENQAGPGTPGRKSGPVSVEIKVVQPELLLNTVSATGTILANEKAEIRPEISGRIIKILFEEGATVQKNKLLVKMNDSDLQAQLKRNEAQGMLLNNDEFQKRKFYFTY